MANVAKKQPTSLDYKGYHTLQFGIRRMRFLKTPGYGHL